MKSRVLLFGANGYIGRHLAYYLMLDSTNLKCFDISDKAALPQMDYQTLDITERSSFDKIDLDVDFIYFFSGLTGTEAGFNNYETYTNVNQTGLNHLLDAMVKVGSKARIIFPSTRLVYKGIKDTPLKEEAEKETLTHYALNKLSCEYLLQMYAKRFGINYTIYRICVPYGNTIDSSYSYGTVGFFMSQAKQGKNITLFGDGLLKRTFTHIEDLCYTILKTSLLKETINDVFNIGGETYSLLDIAKIIAENHGVKVEFIPFPDVALNIESGDTIFDSEKIRSFYNITNQLVSTTIKNDK